MTDQLTVVQVLPALESGGVERGTLEVGRYLASLGHRSFVISAGGRLVDTLRQQGSEHINWNIGRKSLATFRLIPRLRRFLVNNRVDILHVRSRMPAWVCYLTWKSLPKASRPKFITTVHGTYSVNGYSRIMTKGEQILVVSEKIREYVTTQYGVQKNLTLNYRGIDRREFPYGYQPNNAWLSHWYQSFPQTRGKLLITLPGRITRWKGQADFIEIIAELKKYYSDVHGLIVGETKKGKSAFLGELQQRATELGVLNDVSFIGHRSDLREIMSISNIVMSLSLQPEAFGRVSIEALSLGVPVIAYAHGGVEEQLTAVLPEGKVSTGDKAAVVSLSTKWLLAPPVVPESHPFVLESMLETTLSVYKRALTQHSPT